MSYKQLIEGQRYQVEAYLREGFSYREIGRKLKVGHSTISREVRRNCTRSHYLLAVAHSKACKREHLAAKHSMPSLTIAFVEFGLEQKWSPEHIAGVSKIIAQPVSYEWIYGYVQKDKLTSGKLYKHLRQGHRRYCKGSRGKHVIIPNRVGIEHRPAIVDTKTRFGDWQAWYGAIVSLVERKSKFYLIRKVPAKSAAQVNRAMIGTLWRYRRHVHTITADNGSEICEHEYISEKLKTDMYFANPYANSTPKCTTR